MQCQNNNRKQCHHMWSYAQMCSVHFMTFTYQCSATSFLSLLYKWFPVIPRPIFQVLRGLQSRSKSISLISMPYLTLEKYVVTCFLYTLFYEEVMLWKVFEIGINEILKLFFSISQITFTGCFTQCKHVVLRWSDEHSIQVWV